ncbi:MAG: hypothetical protein N3C13_04380 [Aquificaceae bacterium]|nr:hypothetical protein [Aquificaceae bacterium]MCX8060416.1 hypothetical protein [Aquificaceae bacterium]MDW8096643.1 regulatory iron-sulfur-containing complex subunit RicT [Aquificaceae bacterium]
MPYIKARFPDNKVFQVEGLEGHEVSRGDLLVVQSDRGEEVVTVLGTSKEPSTLKALFLRKAEQADIKKMRENERRAQKAMHLCKRKIAEHKLEMKLIKTYIPLDGKKIFFYYTSDQRVDFRGLVRDLAKIFRKRIEMRQVGVRDAVQMLGWVGTCGDVPCCVRFQEDFHSVFLRDIQEQNLPLSPQKFTGPCGRLLCCLAFERENYLVKHLLPEVGTELCLDGKTYQVLQLDPILWKITLSAEGSKRELHLEEILPKGFEKALQHCKSCGGCCSRFAEHEAFAGIEEQS